MKKSSAPAGLGKSKARDISACMKILRDEYGGHVPDDFDKLLKLPGVGRKSANLIMGDVFGKPAIVTDTHCIRLVNRIGLVDGIKEPKKVEMALWKIIPPAEGSDFCIVWCTMGGMCVQPARNLFVNNAVSVIFVGKTA